MKSKISCLILVGFLFSTMGCEPKSAPTPKPSPTPAPALAPGASSSHKAYHIKGTIDDASQEGDVCDITVAFKVPGTLEFEFTPSSPTKGTYTYSGPFNATGSGPYEIFEDGKMLVSGKGCIMGRCAEYSHDWTATKIDPAACKPSP